MDLMLMRCLGAALCAMAFQNALAAFNAEVKISGLRYDVVDLTPADGADAGAVMGGEFDRTSAFIYLFSDANKKTYFANHFVDGATAPFDAGNLKSSASARAMASWDGSQFNMAGRASARVDAEDRGGFQVYFYKSVEFELAPHTLVNWQADYAMSVSVDRSPYSGADWYAVAHLGYGVFPPLVISANVDPALGPAESSLAGRLQFNLSNPYDEPSRQIVGISIILLGGTAREVAEPSQAVLLVLGLAALGWRQKTRGVHGNKMPPFCRRLRA